MLVVVVVEAEAGAMRPNVGCVCSCVCGARTLAPGARKRRGWGGEAGWINTVAAPHGCVGLWLWLWGRRQAYISPNNTRISHWSAHTTVMFKFSLKKEMTFVYPVFF